MTTVVAMVRFLNAVQGRTGETRIAKAGYQLSIPWVRLHSSTIKRNNAKAFFVVGCFGLFLGDLGESSWLVHETGSSASYMVGTPGLHLEKM
jgi:hypothetical protein